MNRKGITICPICKFPGQLVEHHINGRKIPRFNEPWNIVWLCPNCHDAIHSDKLVVEGWFQGTTGKVLMYHKI